MKYKFNIDLDFPGIDTSFNVIENHQERFMIFHNEFLSWVNTKKKRKIKLVNSWKEQLTENMRIAKTLNIKH